MPFDSNEFFKVIESFDKSTNGQTEAIILIQKVLINLCSEARHGLYVPLPKGCIIKMEASGESAIIHAGDSSKNYMLHFFLKNYDTVGLNVVECQSLETLEQMCWNNINLSLMHLWKQKGLLPTTFFQDKKPTAIEDPFFKAKEYTLDELLCKASPPSEFEMSTCDLWNRGKNNSSIQLKKCKSLYIEMSSANAFNILQYLKDYAKLCSLNIPLVATVLASIKLHYLGQYDEGIATLQPTSSMYLTAYSGDNSNYRCQAFANLFMLSILFYDKTVKCPDDDFCKLCCVTMTQYYNTIAHAYISHNNDSKLNAQILSSFYLHEGRCEYLHYKLRLVQNQNKNRVDNYTRAIEVFKQAITHSLTGEIYDRCIHCYLEMAKLHASESKSLEAYASLEEARRKCDSFPLIEEEKAKLTEQIDVNEITVKSLLEQGETENISSTLASVTSRPMQAFCCTIS